MGKKTDKDLQSLAVHKLQGRVLEWGLDLVKVQDVNGIFYSCATHYVVEELDGFIYYAAGKLKLIGSASFRDPLPLNIAAQTPIPIEENIHSHAGRHYGLNPLAHPAGVTLTVEEGLAVMRTFLTAPDYATALVWFYVFGSYAGTPRFSDIVWVGEPGKSLLYIRQNGREAHIVGTARDYVAFWWGLCGGWGNAPGVELPMPSALRFREFFRYLEPEPARARLLTEVKQTEWQDDTDKYVLADESFYELRLGTHSIYFGRASSTIFPLTYGVSGAIPDALPYPHANNLVPWSRAGRVQVAIEHKVSRASLATSLGLPHFVV